MNTDQATLGDHETIAANLAALRGRSAEAVRAAGRDPSEITLVAVGKTFGAERIQAAYEAAQRVFGENRVQEAEAKFPALKAAHPDLVLPLIGPLQTNKAREAARWRCHISGHNS